MLNYDFREVTPFTGVEEKSKIKHGIVYGNFNSTDEGMYLITRDAPSPSEKAITEQVPYMQGTLDFSMLDNQERFFENRTITFTFSIFNQDYSQRSRVENELKRRIMPLGVQKIYDTHLPSFYHWVGKADSVSVDDDAGKRTLTATITFNCYPFAIGDIPEDWDLWPFFYFPHDALRETNFKVDGETSIFLINLGDSTVSPIITVTGTVTVTSGNMPQKFTAGKYEDTKITLRPGENYFDLSGKGTIEFSYYREVMY